MSLGKSPHTVHGRPVDCTTEVPVRCVYKLYTLQSHKYLKKLILTLDRKRSISLATFQWCNTVNTLNVINFVLIFRPKGRKYLWLADKAWHIYFCMILRKDSIWIIPILTSRTSIKTRLFSQFNSVKVVLLMLYNTGQIRFNKTTGPLWNAWGDRVIILPLVNSEHFEKMLWITQEITNGYDIFIIIWTKKSTNKKTAHTVAPAALNSFHDDVIIILSTIIDFILNNSTPWWSNTITYNNWQFEQ